MPVRSIGPYRSFSPSLMWLWPELSLEPTDIHQGPPCPGQAIYQELALTVTSLCRQHCSCDQLPPA